MRYPIKGGYKAFLKPMIQNLDIRINSDINQIDFKTKKITLVGGKEYHFDNLINYFLE